jgi:hypothetical protein
MIRRRRSKLHGWGVFATERIPKNKRIIDYAGEKISHQESLRRENRYMKRDLVLSDQPPLGARRGRRRQPRTIHQSFLPWQLLRAYRRRHHLDSRGADDPQR